MIEPRTFGLESVLRGGFRTADHVDIMGKTSLVSSDILSQEIIT
jgi:hypothetical protein